MSDENFRDIKGYEGLYQIGDKGTVISIKNGKEKVRKLTDNGKGYLTVFLSKGGKRKIFYVHRLVADAYLLRKEGENVVNHKDYNKSNNCVHNLEWCTQKENVRYSSARMKHPKTISKPTNTGEKYIRKYIKHGKYSCYRVYIKTKKICKDFHSVDEALTYRNEVMKDVP